MEAKSQQGLLGPDISLALAEQLQNNKHNDIVKRRAGWNRGNEGTGFIGPILADKHYINEWWSYDSV